jgi:hypothetical protein
MNYFGKLSKYSHEGQEASYEKYNDKSEKKMKDYPIKAFPYEESYMNHGMDLRDYFAAKAMQTILMQNNIDSYGMDFNKIAKQSYHMADAMMEARG